MFCAVCTAAALAQSAHAPDEPLIQITVGVVQVDAVVTDKKGNPVRDLTADDFRILQDGEARQITSFLWVDTSSDPSGAPLRSGPGPRAPEPDRARIRRSIAVVVDDLGMSLSGLNSVRRRLRELVEEGLGGDDLMAIARTSAGRSFASGFTSDPRLLSAALDDLWWRPG